MKIVALLQNQWFRDPERMRERYRRKLDETHPAWLDRCARMNGLYLFYRCLTGRRLQSAFGEERCKEIIWENVSPRIAGKASECFDVDQAHVDAVMDHFRPDVVLLFGKQAQKALVHVPFTLTGPHPAARHAGVVDELREMASDLQNLVTGVLIVRGG